MGQWYNSRPTRDKLMSSGREESGSFMASGIMTAVDVDRTDRRLAGRGVNGSLAAFTAEPWSVGQSMPIPPTLLSGLVQFGRWTD